MVHDFLAFVFCVYMCTHSFTKLHVHTHIHKVKEVKQNVGKHQMNGIHYSHITHIIFQREFIQVHGYHLLGYATPQCLLMNNQSDKPFYVCVNLITCNTWCQSRGCLQLREGDVIMQLIRSGKCVLHCVIHLNSIWIEHYVSHCLISVKKLILNNLAFLNSFQIKYWSLFSYEKNVIVQSQTRIHLYLNSQNCTVIIEFITRPIFSGLTVQ